MIVLEFPPKESLRSHVRTESRYGMKSFLLLGVLCSFVDASADRAKKKKVEELGKIKTFIECAFNILKINMFNFLTQNQKFKTL